MATLLDKTAIPRTDLDLLPRPRVLDRFDNAAHARAIAVSAPGGSGKSVACASWATQRIAPGRISWLTVDAGDRCRSRFWEYVLAALGGVGTESPSDDNDADHERFLTGFIGDLAIASRPVTLVLDDLHEIAGSPVIGDLDLVLRHAPPTFRLVLIGRQLPALQIARLRLAGELDIIDAADLACTQDEAGQLLRMFGIHSTPVELADLMWLTEGWIGGLRLHVLGEDMLTNYVRDEFLDRHKPEVRDFLLQTSVADLLTAELADTLTGRTDSAKRLDMLGRDQGFVHRVNGGHRAFRVHPMIREVLRAELEREQPHEVPHLQAVLGRWHRSEGRPLQALRCAMVAGDLDDLARLLDDDGICLLTSEAAAEADRLLLELPANGPDQHPSILTAVATARMRRGDLDDTRALLDRAEHAAHCLPPGQVAAYRARRAALELALAVRAGAVGPAQQADAWEAAEAASDMPRHPAEHRALGWLAAALGVTHLAHGEPAEARRGLAIAEREFAAAGPQHLHERVTAWLALAEATDGRLRSAVLHARPIGEASVVADLARAALVTVLVEQGEPGRAGELLATVKPWSAEPLLGEPDPAVVIEALHRAEGPIDGGPAATESGASDHHSMSVAARDLRRAWAASQADPAAALDIAAAYIRPGDNLRLLDRISALLVSAVANRRTGDSVTAVRQLEEALGLAEPEGARQVFVDCGNGVRVLLTVAVPVESRFAGFRAEILQRFERTIVTSADPAVPAGLTASERAVLRFLPSHMTNDEIAADLCLSVNTVKTHVRSIYRKLGVGSRRAAIAVAQHHGLVLGRPERVDRIVDLVEHRAVAEALQEPGALHHRPDWVTKPGDPQPDVAVR